MKLEDCKLGMKVMVYDSRGKMAATIHQILDGAVFVGGNNSICFFPQQLRKIVPKKDKPTVGFAFNQDGSWNMPVELTYTNTIDLLKRQGCDVWVMRGTRKL